MRRQSPTTEQVEEMVRLYESGMSLKGVASQLGLSVRTVQSRIHEHGFRRGILVAGVAKQSGSHRQ
ncbi:MAG: sigma factor-like helix-turn-helix DNA-binding protein [Candidatus Nanopelagicales bacterium]